ncbi:MAG: M1 family aminopeptidase [Ferruginibacter sp.]
MKKLYSALLVLSSLLCYKAQSQISPLAQQVRDNEIRTNTLLYSRENEVEATNGTDYDVKYYRLELRLNPDTSIGKYVRGAITTYFTTGRDNFNLVRFDFASALICDSVYYHGAKLAAGNVVEQVDTLKITIPNIAVNGTLDSIKVFYKGVPPTVPTWTTTGFVKGNNTTVGNYIHTLSEPYSAYTWWPCKSMIAIDKADSVDIYVSTPSTFRVAGNGKRISEAVTGSNRLTYWKHRYPISSYQIAVAVADYVQVPTTPTIVNIGGTNMEFYNLLWNGTNTTAASTSLGRTPDMLTVMSSKFSDYPFKDEKYGHYTFGFGGGMEHNTFSGMSTSTYNVSTYWDIIAHELGHQWFGASVTCGSWRDIWVNEGFARYSEVVYLEGKASGNGITTTPTAHRATFKTAALPADVKPIYQADTSTMSAIFSPSVYIYERGAMFISMLRKTLGDTKFFQALQNYQTDPTLQYKNAFTDDVKRHMEAVSGLELDEMFNDWVYKKGYATYPSAKWNNVGNQVMIMMPQVVSGTSDNTHFDMPLVIKFSRTSPAADTTIILFDKGGVLYNDNNGVFTSSWGSNLIQVGLSFVPTAVSFDPESEILATATFTKDATLTLLATKIAEFSAKKENKDARLYWSIDQSFDYNAFEIERSLNGTTFEKIGTQTAAQNTTNARSFYHTDRNMPIGIVYYRIKIIERDGSSFYTKVAVVNNKQTAVFEVNPNPAIDNMFISHNDSKTIIANIRIVDAAGKLVKTFTKQSLLPGAKLAVNVKDMPPGIYYVEIEAEQYFKMIKKVMVIR